LPADKAGGWFREDDVVVAQQGKERERCVLQARSSGSTTPRVTGSSSATEAVTCSSTTRPFRATGSARSRKARRLSSRSLTVRKARRPETSPRSSHPLAAGRPSGARRHHSLTKRRQDA